MLVLAHGTGAQDFDVLAPVLPSAAWHRIRSTAIQLLRKRHQLDAAAALESVPFELLDGTNVFGDEFCVLQATVPLDQYVDLTVSHADSLESSRYRELQSVFSELGYHVRFVLVEVAPSDGPAVTAPTLEIQSRSVEQALRDAETLLVSSGPASAVDRVHTAFHGYLIALSADAGIPVPQNASITVLFKTLRTAVPAIAATQPRILNSLANIVDALDPIRNRQSLAHPNPSLLSEPDAMLVINTVRTLLHYLNAVQKGDRPV